VTDDAKFPPYVVLKARVKAKQCLFEHPLPDVRRHAVFNVLIDHMGDDGTCYPGVSRVARITKLSRPTITKYLTEFAANKLTEELEAARKGRNQRIRLHPERLSEVGKSEFATANPKVAKLEFATAKLEPDSGGYNLPRRQVVKNAGESCKARVSLNRKPLTVLVPKATDADDSNASAPPTPKKINVQEQTDSPSHDAVQKSARGPPTPEQRQIRAREADMSEDCKGALVSKSGGLYLPWGPRLDPDRVRAMRADLVGMIATLATLEAWTKEDRDDVLARAICGRLSDLLPNFRYFEKRVIEAQCRIAAAELRDSHTWHGEGFEKRMTDKPATTRDAKKYRNRKPA